MELVLDTMTIANMHPLGCIYEPYVIVSKPTSSISFEDRKVPCSFLVDDVGFRYGDGFGIGISPTCHMDSNSKLYVYMMFFKRTFLTPKVPCVIFSKLCSFVMVGKINFSKNKSMII
jgi:hypothetical protein